MSETFLIFKKEILKRNKNGLDVLCLMGIIKMDELYMSTEFKELRK